MEDINDPKQKYNFNDIKQLIDIKIYRFLFMLMKNIFLVPGNSSTISLDAKNKLDKQLKQINDNNKNNFKINKEYTKENLSNILKYVKTQNKIYAAEILENILIIIFSYGFECKKENTFGKYIYNSIERLKNSENVELAEWFEPKKFNIFGRKDDIIKILQNDILIEENKDKQLNTFQKENVFINFLLELYREKNDLFKYKARNKTLSYLREEKFYSNFFEDEKKKDTDSTQLDSKELFTANTGILFFFTGEIGKGNRSPIPVVRSFFISVYIYYQNKYSPLMKYIKEEEDEEKYLAKISFSYDLTGASIQYPYAGIIMAPSRIEPRINSLIMQQNTLKENGCFELSKTLKFNKNISVVNFHRSALKPIHILSLIQGLGFFENYNVEELDLSSNYFKNDKQELLAKLLSNLKGLKTINLTNNSGLKDGISSFLIVLKNLYRQNKTNLDNLNLNKCSLDDISIYELGELLKSKYCKLKHLYLDINKIPSSINFLKRLKKNKSLTEIHFNESNLGNNDTDNIMRIISNTNIENLYLYKNTFNNFDDCLRIIYRTKLVLDKEEKKNEININKEGDSLLYNLDLSDNGYFNNNKEQIDLLQEIIEETTLYSLDLSHILFGKDPNYILNKVEENPDYFNTLNKYQKHVYKLKKMLDDKQNIYKEKISELLVLNVDINKLKNLKKEDYFEELEYEIKNIIQEENAIYPTFLKENAKKLIRNNSNIFGENLNNNEKKDIIQNLVNYMTYKRAKENSEIIKKKIEKKKLILI